MATERRRQRDHGAELETIRAGAASSTWADRLAAVESMRGLLRDLPTEETVERILEILNGLQTDAKWQVRRAVVHALVDTAHPLARPGIERLADDDNPWVRHVAERARRKVARITTAGDKRDRRVEFAYDVVRDLKTEFPARAYEAALRVGERYYEELAADTAHELNTYRAVVEGLLTELEQELGPSLKPGTKSILAKLRGRSAYLKALVADLVYYSRDSEAVFEVEPLAPLVAEAMDIAREKAKARLARQPVRETFSVSDGLALEACRPRLVRALANLLSNAYEALDGRGDGAAVEVSAALKDAEHVVLILKDTGCGMDSQQLEAAKKRFKSLKKEQGGIGLGLPMAIKIVSREHGGRLDIESAPEIGTTVTIELPISRAKEP